MIVGEGLSILWWQASWRHLVGYCGKQDVVKITWSKLDSMIRSGKRTLLDVPPSRRWTSNLVYFFTMCNFWVPGCSCSPNSGAMTPTSLGIIIGNTRLDRALRSRYQWQCPVRHQGASKGKEHIWVTIWLLPEPLVVKSAPYLHVDREVTTRRVRMPALIMLPNFWLFFLPWS